MKIKTLFKLTLILVSFAGLVGVGFHFILIPQLNRSNKTINVVNKFPQTGNVATPGTTSTLQLIDRPFFKKNEQSSVLIHPRFNDGSTNIIFYINYGNNNFQYNAETTGHGALPFSDYFTPPPGIGKYVAVEYNNGRGTFGCSGIPLNECVANPHFISQYSFEVIDNNMISPASH